MLAQNTWILIPLTLLLTVVLACLLIPFAYRFGWVDHPGERKVHEFKTPIIGGLAIFSALMTTYLLIRFTGVLPALSRDTFILGLLFCAAAMLLIGLLDDFFDLHAPTRLLLQGVFCVSVILYTGVHLEDFGHLFSSELLVLGWVAVPITVFAALGAINAFNLIDGLDGLSGSIYLIAAGGMVFFVALGGKTNEWWILMLSSAGVIGFLLLNARWPWNTRARTFLGNAGSLMLGTILAWCLIRLGSGPERAFMPMTAVWLIAVPLMDTSTLIWRRWRDGRSALSADQNHLHHAFLRAGFSVGQTCAAICTFALVLALLGSAFEVAEWPEYISFYSFMLLAFAYYFYMKHCWASQRFLGRHFIHHDFTIE